MKMKYLGLFGINSHYRDVSLTGSNTATLKPTYKITPLSFINNFHLQITEKILHSLQII